MKKFTSVLFVSLMTIGFVLVAMPVNAEETLEVHEACGVFTYTPIPPTTEVAASGVACALLEFRLKVWTCSSVQGGPGNVTHPEQFYDCVVTIDWQLQLVQAGNPLVNATAEFRLDNTSYEKRSLTPLLPLRTRLGPIADTIRVEGAEPYEVMGELCVVYRDTSSTCTKWLAASLAPYEG